MSLIINNVTGSDYSLPEIGITVPANGNYDATLIPEGALKRSTTLYEAILDEDLTVSDGVNTYTKVTAINIISGFPILKFDENRHTDGRLSIQQTSRPRGTKILRVGISDDLSLDTLVSNGTLCQVSHAYGAQNTGETDANYWVDHTIFGFNTVINKTYVNDCTIRCYNAPEGAFGNAYIATTKTNWTAGTDTPYLGLPYLGVTNGIIIPAACVAPNCGNLTIDLENVNLVQAIADELGVKPPGYWDATLNLLTHELEDITPNYYGTGNYNIFGEQIKTVQLVNTWWMSGTSVLEYGSSDVENLPHGVLFIVEAWTPKSNDAAWKYQITYKLCRERSI